MRCKGSCRGQAENTVPGGALLCACIRLEWRERQWEGGCKNRVPVEGKEQSDSCAGADLEAWGGDGGKICKSCICLFWP